MALNTELPEKDEVTPVVGGHRVEGAKWTCESLKRRKVMWRVPQGKSEIHVATSRVKSLPLRKDMTSNASLRSGTTPPWRPGQLRPARGRNGRAWKAGLVKIAEFGVRSAAATDTVPTFVKLLREAEESTSDLAGYGSPAMRFVPVRTAELSLEWRWGVDAVWTPGTVASMRRLTPQAHEFPRLGP